MQDVWSVFYVPYSLLLISNKFSDLSLLHCVQSYRTGALKGGGMSPKTSNVHKITNGPLIDKALYVMCLMGANP